MDLRRWWYRVTLKLGLRKRSTNSKEYDFIQVHGYWKKEGEE